MSSIQINAPGTIKVASFDICQKDWTGIEYENDLVTSLGNHAMEGIEGSPSLSFPNVTSVGNFCFHEYSIGAVNFNLVSFPKLIDVGSYGFYCVKAKTWNIKIPATIGNYGFAVSNIASIDLTNTTSIGDCAFQNCSSLTSITWSSSVTTIPYGVFQYCSALTSFIIPSGITSIGSYAFSGCSSIAPITIPNTVTSIGSYVFSNCPQTSITIPDSVTTLGRGALGNTNVTSITIPFVGQTATTNTFLGYIFGASSYSQSRSYIPSSLKTVIISNKCTSIETYAFYGCSGLTSISIPSSVTSIGTSAFNGCSSLTSITIPSSVTSIGQSAFSSCTGLTSITIPGGVTSIEQYTFYNCSSLRSITIPTNISSIGYNILGSCSSLESITIPFVGQTATTNTFLGYLFGASSASETPSVMSLFLKTVIISDGCTSIGSNAFYGCSYLTSITIPSSVTSIGGLAFQNCSSLTSIIIPSGVTEIPINCFDGCGSMTLYDFSSATAVPTLYSTTSLGHASGCTIRVPSSLLTDWQSASIWADLTDVTWEGV